MTNVPALPTAPYQPVYILNVTKDTDNPAYYQFTVNGNVAAEGHGGWERNRHRSRRGTGHQRDVCDPDAQLIGGRQALALLTIGDTNGEFTDLLTITTTGASGTLCGTGLSGGSNGVYRLTQDSAASVTRELR